MTTEQITISEGNDKIGGVINVSLSPIVTCLRGVPCAKPTKCYALGFYASALDAYKKNTRILKADRDGFFNQIIVACEKHVKKSAKKGVDPYFRWHVAGDIPDQDYFNRMRFIAERFPMIHFLVFTKKHTLDLSAPKNLAVIYSMWMGWGHVIPCVRHAWVWDGTETRIPKNSFMCPGGCNSCGICWRINQFGRDVVFVIHGGARHKQQKEQRTQNLLAFLGEQGSRMNPPSSDPYRYLQPGFNRPFVPKHWR